jgi:hypothetical protein
LAPNGAGGGFIDMPESALAVMKKRARDVGELLAVVIALLGPFTFAPHARACSTAAPVPFQVDPSLQDEDTTPPTAFTDIVPFVRRISATHCHADRTCTQSSCGDDGVLELSFVAPSDDHSPPAELGYRVVWLSGSMPDGLGSVIDQTQPLGDQTKVSISLGFDGVTELNGELALIAVDRAGNESAPSEPVHVEYSGCTSYFDDATCMGARVVPAGSCAVRPPNSQAVAWVLPLVVGLAFVRRRGLKRARG